MFETYRMLGREREIEFLAEAERLRPLKHRRHGPRPHLTLLVSAVAVVVALLVWLGTSGAVV
jgi:hypothetical protein